MAELRVTFVVKNVTVEELPKLKNIVDTFERDNAPFMLRDFNLLDQRVEVVPDDEATRTLRDILNEIRRQSDN